MGAEASSISGSTTTMLSRSFTTAVAGAGGMGDGLGVTGGEGIWVTTDGDTMTGFLLGVKGFASSK